MREKSIGIKTVKRKLKREEIPFDKYIGHTKRFLRLFWMWEFDEDSSSRYSKSFVILNAAVLLTSNFILGLSELIKLESAPDLRSVASGVGSFWLHFIGFFKWLYFVWNVRDVMDLVGQLEECYILGLAISEVEESSSRLLKEMNGARKSSVRFMYTWCLLVTYGIIHWCLNPVFYNQTRSTSSNGTLANDVRLLPYEAWIPWDITGSLGYTCAYAFQFLGGCASCIGSVSYDIFYLSMIMMICAQLRFLNYSLTDERLEKDSMKPNNKLTCSFLEHKLIRGKIYHNAILKFLASLERVTSPVMFVQCVGTIGILCLVSFEATTVKLEGNMNSLIRIWSMLEYFVDCLAQLFCFCFYATEVTTLGLQVGYSTYSCSWESAEMSDENELSMKGPITRNRGKKNLGFLIGEIIIRAQKPVQLTGGLFYVLSLETFCTVVSAAFSYSTVLRGFSD